MNTVGEKEINTHGRAIYFFQDALGYTYLGNWQSRANNSNIEKTRAHRVVEKPRTR